MSIPLKHHFEKPMKQVTIEPVTRVEGHGKVTLILDGNGHVERTRLHIVEFRGFERFVQGRPYWEAPVIVERLCGICPVSHHLAAAKATDIIVGVGPEGLSPTAEKMRRLMHYGQMLQSHALHFYHLCSPDLLFGFDSDVLKRNVIAVAHEYPEIARQGILLRRYGQEIIKATAGKKIHGTGAIPGGINKNLSLEERDVFLKDIGQMIEWSLGAVELVKKLHAKDPGFFDSFGSFQSNHLSLVRKDGALDFYHGNLRAKDADGNKILDQVDYADYLKYIAEEVRAWSYMKFPFIRQVGKRKGWYRVGPLARLNCCDFIPSPLAQKELELFKAYTNGKPNNFSLHYHWARMIEMLHAAEVIKELLHDKDLQGEELVRKGERKFEGVGLVEAPRGTLFHHYRINENSQIAMCNLIVSTTNNNEPMNQAVTKVAYQFLEGRELTEGLLNHIEVAIRAYDPCLSCATHALGQMPLVVELKDSKGELIQRKVRGAA
ncbi:MAG TPA: Ni/Fe hydrogenase subunit alpha [archaeon]|nr:Ni/Fe hydrogenase subunit alpha [archaeon]